jgi:hypothetical protein
MHWHAIGTGAGGKVVQLRLAYETARLDRASHVLLPKEGMESACVELEM